MIDKCLLFTDSVDDDRRAMLEAGQQALNKVRHITKWSKLRWGGAGRLVEAASKTFIFAL